MALTKYDFMGASSRMRSLQYIPYLSVNGFFITFQAFFNNASLAERYRSGSYGFNLLVKCYIKRIFTLLNRNNYDLLWIEKESLPWLPLWIESLLLRKTSYVLDYDDALFHQYDQNSFKIIRLLFGNRLDVLMSRAALVICGNTYLADRALAAGSQNVKIIPTVVDISRYPCPMRMPSEKLAVLRIVWIGSPSTVRYLENLSDVFEELAARIPFVLRVIGADLSLANVQVECFPWSLDTEAQLISDCDVGIMPLLDSDWERGKCGYKLIQYMACGLPVVASPVGVNVDIVQNNRNGFLAEEKDGWIESLSKLLCDPHLRFKMGLDGRKDVEEKYCLDVTAPKLEGYLRLASLPYKL